MASTSMNTNRAGSSPPNLDSVEDRKKMFSEALSTTDDEEASEAEKSNASVTPSKVKNKPQKSNPLNKLKANKNATSAVSTNTSTPQSVTVARSTNATSSQYQDGATKTNGRTYQIEGSNIGSKACEPAWTKEEMQAIADAEGKRLNTVLVTDTRRSEPDPERKYLTRGANDSIVTRPAAILPTPGYNEYSVGIGRVKPDEKTGKSKLYSDIVMKGPNWLLSQWTSKNVVLEVVPDGILDKAPRIVNGKPERRIGHDFARIGLPKLSFAPIFETLRSSMPSVLDATSHTGGYYWMNASWGVSGSPGNFIYKGEGGVQRNTHRLYEAMKMLQGSSAIGSASIAVSVGNESRMEGGKLVPDPGKYELSIKIHNMFFLKRVPYHSPPQSSATGFEVDEDIFGEAETLTTNTGTSSVFGSTAAAFSGGAPNPFMGVNAAVAPSALPGQSQQLLF